MIKELVGVCQVYANAKPGVDYVVLENYYDYVVVKCQGKPLCIPDYLLTSPMRAAQYNTSRPEFQTYEDIIAQEMAELEA